MGLLKKVNRYANDRYLSKNAKIIMQLPTLAHKFPKGISPQSKDFLKQIRKHT